MKNTLNQTVDDKNNFLISYIENFNKLNIATPFLNSFVKDIESKYLAASNGFLKLAYPDVVELKDTTIKDDDFEVRMLKNTKEFAKKIREQDLKVINEAKPFSFLNIQSNTNAFIVRKYPIINPFDNKVVGVLGEMQVFFLPNILKIIFKMNGIKIGILNNKENNKLIYELTEKQHMVLFLSLYKYSYTEIASIMRTLGYQISDGRVNAHFENLKYLFVVRTKEQLIEKAISLGYHAYIPRKFLKVGTYDLNEEMMISEN